jgi:hypothetical protein
MIIMRSFFIIALFAVSLALHSQVEESVAPDKEGQKEKSKLSERLTFGGEIGLSFGSITYIKLAPIVGYYLTDRLVAGVGPIYIYEKYKYYNYETSMYGGKVFTSFTIIKGSAGGGGFGLGNIQLHVENEVLNVEKYDFENERIWIDNLLLGGGLFQPFGGRGGISIFILFDVTQNRYSPYYSNNPVFKFGFNF